MTSTVRAGKIVVWKDAVLRGTGFPADLLLRAAATSTVAAIDANATRDVLEAAFKEDTRRIGELLREVVAMPAFREAVLWQNRTAVHGSMASLLKRPAGAVDSKTREYERLVASYLQRYCAKNDTIGFFGPVGWATLDATTESKLTPAPELCEKRTVYFEHWAVDKLAERMSQTPELREHIAPVRMPTVFLEGDVLHVPVAKTNRLPPEIARLVRMCDGTRPAKAIAEELAEELGGIQDVYDLLDELVDNKIVIWRLQVATAGFFPERALRMELAKLAPSDARTRAEAMLTELEHARDGVAAAAGTVEPLDAAMVILDELFVRLTGTDASRNAGKTYAGRRTFFEDCRRGGELVLGRGFLDKIAAPLELITTSARWFSSRVAAEYRVVFRDHYRALVERTGSSQIDFIQFYTELQPLLSSQQGTLSPTVLRIREELQARWTKILALPADTKRVVLRSEDLAPLVREAFASDGPGWPMARHHSPDLMIAAH
ncbi:MAG TPA: lantibiotic dehydratase, partial [Kofleriaceae bacterium]